MAKKPVKKDNFALYTVLTVLLILVTGFMIAWFYRESSKVVANAAFVEFAPLTIATDGYTIAAHLAVQTSPEDADWASEHKRNLLGVLQSTLAGSDPKKMMTPNDLRMLQSSLKDAGNQALHTGKVQDVLLTDFLIKAD